MKLPHTYTHRLCSLYIKKIQQCLLSSGCGCFMLRLWFAASKLQRCGRVLPGAAHLQTPKLIREGPCDLHWIMIVYFFLPWTNEETLDNHTRTLLLINSPPRFDIHGVSWWPICGCGTMALPLPDSLNVGHPNFCTLLPATVLPSLLFILAF